MKKALFIFLQSIIIFIGVTALVFMLVEPLFEGRNINSTVFEVYFHDPFLAYAYIASITFFIALNKIFTVLNNIKHGITYSQSTVTALGSIKFCALILIGFVIPPLAYLIIARPEDDVAGGVAINLFIILISAFVAILAVKFERYIKPKVNV